MQEDTIAIQQVEHHLKRCQNDVLQVVEAAHSDPVQRSAVVKLIKDQFNRRLEIIRSLPKLGVLAESA